MKTGAVAALVLSLGLAPATHAAVVSMPLTARSAPSQDVVVPIKVSPATGVTSMDLSFTYDEAVAIPTGAFRTGATDGFATLDANLATPGAVNVFLSGGGPLTGSPDVVWIVFRVVGAPSTFTDLVWTAATLNGGGVSATTQNGRITAISAAASVGSPDTPTGAPMTQVQIPIFANPATGGEGFDLAVRFNPNVIVPQSVATTPLTAGMSLTSNLAVPGEVRAALFGTNPVSGSGPLVTVTYNVVGSLNERTPLDVFRGDINEQSISSALDDGLFTVCTAADLDGDTYSTCEGDCNDGQPAVNPGAAEVCNGIDDDCSGGVDDVAVPSGLPFLDIDLRGGFLVFSWSPVANSVAYDLLRGNLTALRSSGGDFSVSTEVCLANDFPGNSIPVTGVLGDDKWYLVRALNCGGNGTYDEGSSQAAPRDPGIAASPNDCP